MPESLAKYTTLKTGGTAEAIFIPNSLEALSHKLQATELTTPVTFLGLGSNSLIQDQGVTGLVIILQGSGLTSIKQLDSAYFMADAGVACGQFARYVARLGYQGTEFMAGIPGTIGGALAMNAGCWGGEIWDFVTKVKVINRLGQVFERDKTAYSINYRSAKLVPYTSQVEEFFLAAEFNLTKGDRASALAEIKHLLAKRQQSQPTNFPNCGSVFRNPPNDHAARLIEACGLKGKQIGQAQISAKHANFIVNLGGATSADILALIQLIQHTVKQKFNILLEREVKILGDHDGQNTIC